MLIVREIILYRVSPCVDEIPDGEVGPPTEQEQEGTR